MAFAARGSGPPRPALTPPAPADAEMPREALRFHAEAVGAQVRLDAQRSTARRRATFRDGIVFSQRPVRPGERVELRVLCHECGWVGGLRVGFTRLDPERVTASGLPPFVCPDLEQQSPTWAAMLPDGCGLTGDVVRFWVNRLGRLFAQVNAGPRLLLRKDVLMGAPLWAVMDVYGTTKAIELLDPTVSAPTPAMPWVLSDEALPESKGSFLPAKAFGWSPGSATMNLAIPGTLESQEPTCASEKGLCVERGQPDPWFYG
ncbi:E3 ubiquitin-protein ligase NEURL3 isoform X2 [Delphinapterus leucas]|uniref:E3 ubiquitin-protein ligase NEURL3 n=1 Tax=Delphinapterus leucas TaxID=9749 RepID=A0A2Y9Q6F6_DELLE|nr:E3 ubiquitin-protein ligase NEURL3 isoform X2 [Delphinapterus leucas]XP_022454669.1 E3 ubiquitin-protein ligase NEURL3 isoform X2 [Delphinapterus leucas]